MSNTAKLTRIKLKNFTAFSNLNLKLSPGVNVIIGANSTGKTHLLKILYAATAITTGEDREKSFRNKLLGVFNPYKKAMTRLIRRQQGLPKASIIVERGDGAKLRAEIDNQKANVEDVIVTGQDEWRKVEMKTAYIPVKEMLAHAPFLKKISKREIELEKKYIDIINESFEEIYIYIIKKSFLPQLRGPHDDRRKLLLSMLQQAIEGRVEAKDEHFFLRDKGQLEFNLLAEGLRKLALIWLLIQNGTLLSGSVLFWDEPEANLNPNLMGKVVEVILELHRLGVQVFLATHNYVILKEFDLRQKQKDSIRYISLYQDKDNDGRDVIFSSYSDCYSGIDHNAILETFGKLYDSELLRADISTIAKHEEA